MLYRRPLSCTGIYFLLNCIMRGKKMRPIKSEPAAGGDDAQQAGNDELQNDVEEVVLPEGDRGRCMARHVRPRLAREEAAAPDVESDTNTLLALSQAHAVAVQDLERRIQALTESRDVALREKDVALREKDVAVMEKDVALREKDVALRDADQQRQMHRESTEQLNRVAESYLRMTTFMSNQRESSEKELSRLRRKYGELASEFAQINENLQSHNVYIHTSADMLRDQCAEIQFLRSHIGLHGSYGNATSRLSAAKYSSNFEGCYSSGLSYKFQGYLRCSDNKMHGFGVQLLSNGDIYTGEFLAGLRDGFGTYVWSDGEKYKGEWRLDKKHGQGEKTWTTGEIYRGEYAEDEMQGRGTKEHPSGLILSGVWVQGVFQS